jgi:hypothetical protein
MSTDTQFKDFVQRQRKPASEDVVDWRKEKEERLAHLERLYNLASEYLHEYINSNAIQVYKSSIELNEENIGTYAAKRLTIVIGAQEITLTPVGTLLIGTKGRVDVKGSAGSSRLVLINKGITRPEQMIRITSTIVRPGKMSSPPPTLPETLPEKIEWTWRIVSRPPTMQFIDLNKETFYQMLMEVSNG